MNQYPARLQALISSLRTLPGVGPKSAQRMAFHLLDGQRASMHELADSLVAAADGLRECMRCRNIAEAEHCPVCESLLVGRRDASQLCVVETPADLLAVEQGADYRGGYFVLHGKLSPLDGVGPGQLRFDLLEQRLADDDLEEVILAVSSTVEGEATAHYISELARSARRRVSRIAHGVPMGGELEFVDAGTLAHAFSGRRHL